VKDDMSAPEKFTLHQRLIDATIPLGQTNLSIILMINDRRYPWVLVVPKRTGVEEIFALNRDDRITLMEEISTISRHMTAKFNPCRINIADIGNRVAQLHIHIVARQLDDPAWPKVVWSRERLEYEDMEGLAGMNEALTEVCSALDSFIPH
jgi:diadenosine tetraphosphate (Ap4A) HIT family hydrolase